MSRSYLYRVIKDEPQLSTTRYLRKRRLLKTKELLLKTDLRISEICDHVGFTSPQNLSTYFAEEFGLSPTEFRKKQRPDSAEPQADASDTPAETPPQPSIGPDLPTREGPDLARSLSSSLVGRSLLQVQS